MLCPNSVKASRFDILQKPRELTSIDNASAAASARINDPRSATRTRHTCIRAKRAALLQHVKRAQVCALSNHAHSRRGTGEVALRRPVLLPKTNTGCVEAQQAGPTSPATGHTPPNLQSERPKGPTQVVSPKKRDLMTNPLPVEDLGPRSQVTDNNRCHLGPGGRVSPQIYLATPYQSLTGLRLRFSSLSRQWLLYPRAKTSAARTQVTSLLTSSKTLLKPGSSWSKQPAYSSRVRASMRSKP